jgi:putative ABC transport system permease protein
MRGLWLRLVRLLRRRASEREIGEELRLHVEMEAEKHERAGVPRREARRRALVALGGADRWREEVRGARGTAWIEDTVRDVRLATRGLIRSPGFAAAAIGAIALGVGATTAIYSVVDQVVLSPLPYPESDELVTVWMRNARQGTEEGATSWPNFLDWREAATTLDGLATVLPIRYTLTGEGEPEQVTGATVSRGFFELVGHPLALGRPFRDDEVEGGVVNTVVLSHELFARRFGADPSVVGSTIELDGATYDVVGVTRPGAGYPRDAELWTPQAFPADEPLTMYPRRRFIFPVVGRLADGVQLTVAQAEMDAIAARLEEAWPEVNRGVGVELEPLHETIVGDVRTPLVVLLGAVAAVLLIAVVNVANLLLARGAVRTRELAARLALGAGHGRIVRQVMADSALLGGLGGLTGAALASLGVSALVAAGPADLPRLDEVRPDWLILGVALAVALGATFAFGLAPALQAGGVDPAVNLRKSARGSSSAALGHVRGSFIAGQFALALVLLVGSGLLVQSFLNLRRVDPGFETEGVLSVTLDLSPARYPDSESRGAFYQELFERVSAVPGVESLGTITNLLLTDQPVGTPTVESRPDQFGPDTEVAAVSDVVSPGLFSTIELDIVAGRGLEETDGPDATRVAVVNETFARRFLAGLDPVGQRFTWLYQGDGSYWFTIVGVVEDARRSGPAAPVLPAVFTSVVARPGYHTEMLIRTAGDPLSLASAVRDAVHAIDDDIPLSRVRTLQQAMADQLAQRRYVSWLLGVFALAALTLAAIGIFGVMAYVVGRRTREIGIRVALGAARARLLSDVLREGMLHAGAGLVLGVLASLGLTRLVQSQLFGLEATDPATFVAASTLLLLVAMLACALPARRAAAVDAMVALRED